MERIGDMPLLLLFVFRFVRLLLSGHQAVAIENAALRMLWLANILSARNRLTKKRMDGNNQRHADLTPLSDPVRHLKLSCKYTCA